MILNFKPEGGEAVTNEFSAIAVELTGWIHGGNADEVGDEVNKLVTQLVNRADYGIDSFQWQIHGGTSWN